MKTISEDSSKVTINPEQKLFVIHSGKSYSCLGFDVLEKRFSVLSKELSYDKPASPVGTVERYNQYQELCKLGSTENKKSGWRSKACLTIELIPYERQRVKVKHQWDSGNIETTSFIVGKSTGWMPCHLMIDNKNSSGGPGVALGRILSLASA